MPGMINLTMKETQLARDLQFHLHDSRSTDSDVTDPLGSVFFTPLEPLIPSLSERVFMRNSPVFVIFDSGCAKAMGSRYAVNGLMKEC